MGTLSKFGDDSWLDNPYEKIWSRAFIYYDATKNSAFLLIWLTSNSILTEFSHEVFFYLGDALFEEVSLFIAYAAKEVVEAFFEILFSLNSSYPS